MDDSGSGAKQNESAVHGVKSSRYPFQDQQPSRRNMAGSATERFRPAPLNTSASRGIASTSNYGGYYQDSAAAFSGANMAQGGLPYQPSDYNQDARQQQAFGTYNPTMMYPVSQAAAQNPYDASQQFPGRQPGTMSIMPSEVPQYFPSDGGASTPSSALPAAQSSGAAYQQAQQISAFSGTLPSAGAGLASSQTAASGVGVDEADYSVPATGAGLEERWADYQARLATVFQDIRSGSLKRASETLLELSNWLLSQVVDLGKPLRPRSFFDSRTCSKAWTNMQEILAPTPSNSFGPWPQANQGTVMIGRSQCGRPNPPCRSAQVVERLQSCMARAVTAAKRHGRRRAKASGSRDPLIQG